LYLDGRPRPTRETYAMRVRELVSLVREEHEIIIGPDSSTQPALWLCGSSVASAILAGELGMHFACHRQSVSSLEEARAIITAYRESYRGTDAPYSAIAVYGTCAETESSAQHLWSGSAGSLCFIGTGEACADQLHSMISICGANEAVIHLLIHDIDARIAGYRLLAEAAGLE